jgi:surfeit locus 1 family protein
MRKLLVPLIFGIAGVAVLVGLGIWQVQRLAWKEGVLERIETRIAAEPGPLPAEPDPRADRYRPVVMTGRVGEGALRVLVSRKRVGAGYRLVSPFETGGRRVLLDRGFVPVEAEIPAPPPGEVRVAGNLHWPDDRNSSTPDNDVAGNTWFARDLIARELSPPEPSVTPLPVDTRGIPNDHLEYAITWFSLAGIWAAMTGYLIWRIRKQPGGRTP